MARLALCQRNGTCAVRTTERGSGGRLLGAGWAPRCVRRHCHGKHSERARDVAAAARSPVGENLPIPLHIDSGMSGSLPRAGGVP